MENTLLTRLRVGMSELKSHLFQIQKTESPYCNHCQGRTNENTGHYLLKCPKYTQERERMTNIINGITGIDIHNLSQKEQLDFILHGNTVRPRDEFEVARAVYQFIHATKRFASPSHPATYP